MGLSTLGEFNSYQFIHHFTYLGRTSIVVQVFSYYKTSLCSNLPYRLSEVNNMVLILLRLIDNQVWLQRSNKLSWIKKLFSSAINYDVIKKFVSNVSISIQIFIVSILYLIKSKSFLKIRIIANFIKSIFKIHPLSSKTKCKASKIN